MGEKCPFFAMSNIIPMSNIVKNVIIKHPRLYWKARVFSVLD